MQDQMLKEQDWKTQSIQYSSLLSHVSTYAVVFFFFFLNLGIFISLLIKDNSTKPSAFLNWDFMILKIK